VREKKKKILPPNSGRYTSPSRKVWYDSPLPILVNRTCGREKTKMGQAPRWIPVSNRDSGARPTDMWQAEQKLDKSTPFKKEESMKLAGARGT
jgi:hypothetical protein